MWPESMERMGFVRICKEAAQLLRHHFRLFLPFLLAFHLPASFLSVFYNAFLVVPQNQLYKNVLNSAYTTVGHEEELKDTDSGLNSIILSFVVVAPTFVLSALGTVAFTFIVDYIYSDRSDDDAITWRRVLKLLPHAFLRVFVTVLWRYLALLVLIVACGVVALVLLVLYIVVTGVDPPPPAVLLVVFNLPLLVGTVALAVLFLLSPFVAVLEPEMYGREALKQSRRYARGRAWIIFRVVAFWNLAASVSFFAQGLATAGFSPAAEVAAACVMSVVYSFLCAYGAVVTIVTYFVCKSGYDAAGLPVVAAENPYRPVASGGNQIGEP